MGLLFLSFACAKSLIESIGGICLGMPGKLLAWPVSIVPSLSVLKCTWWAHTCQGWKALSECSRKGETKQKKLRSHPQCCCAQQEMLLPPKHLNYQWRHQIPPHQLSGQGIISWEILHSHRERQVPQESPPSKKAQHTWYSMHSPRLDCLHGPSVPHPSDYIALSLTGCLYSADILQHCSGFAPSRLYPESSTELSIAVSTTRELEKGEITNLLSAGMHHKYPSGWGILKRNSNHSSIAVHTSSKIPHPRWEAKAKTCRKWVLLLVCGAWGLLVLHTKGMLTLAAQGTSYRPPSLVSPLPLHLYSHKFLLGMNELYY